ncbi:3-dehydroquinate synthase [Spirochaetia bacterium]|nr:3-dehydroquinate synthase [Spirochaetia bacterium]
MPPYIHFNHEEFGSIVKKDYTFTFAGTVSEVHIQDEIPTLDTIFTDMGQKGPRPASLLICDENTLPIARKITGEDPGVPICTLQSGEEKKTWGSVEKILGAAKAVGLGRDGIFIAAGGGVISDLTAFAASIYMRGSRLCIVSTTLLGMVDAAVGGKTGFDLFGVKNFAGTFFPAAQIYLPVESLKTLPKNEWKSGMAELIKTAVLDRDEEFFRLLKSFKGDFPRGDKLIDCIARSVALKGRIVEADPKETGTERALLNLGHTFGHALESVAGLGRLSHGEAVAWGMARSCELGLALGITPKDRADAIISLLRSFAYETAAPHPLMETDAETFLKALGGDKKKKGGKLTFIVPAAQGGQLVSDTAEKPITEFLLKNLVNGGSSKIKNLTTNHTKNTN